MYTIFGGNKLYTCLLFKYYKKLKKGRKTIYSIWKFGLERFCRANRRLFERLIEVLIEPDRTTVMLKYS